MNLIEYYSDYLKDIECNIKQIKITKYNKLYKKYNKKYKKPIIIYGKSMGYMMADITHYMIFSIKDNILYDIKTKKKYFFFNNYFYKYKDKNNYAKKNIISNNEIDFNNKNKSYNNNYLNKSYNNNKIIITYNYYFRKYVIKYNNNKIKYTLYWYTSYKIKYYIFNYKNFIFFFK